MEIRQSTLAIPAILDPDDGKPLFGIAYEVRLLTHPFYARRLLNRDPEQGNLAVAPGHQERSRAMPYAP